MASTSTTTSMECENNEEINQKQSIKNSCEYATSPLSSKVQESVKSVEKDVSEESICSSGFTTPKGERFRIPKIALDDCPPAPKKIKSIMLSPKRFQVDDMFSSPSP
ncbi:unnamed protein product [Vicia faba]|uniref:Uncharacterized protein n=1 Tax=Vicia faba TaxID=3906 RepID=A0AAV0YUT0_VICFA|nr:unnamed protein product [Vicia faba]